MRRLDRVSQLFKDEIGRIIQQELKDTRLGFITVTMVKLTPDLRQAWVYVSVLGDEVTKEKAKEGLESASGYVKKLIGERIKMRYTPEITFELDESFEKVKYIEDILDKIKQEGKEKE